MLSLADAIETKMSDVETNQNHCRKSSLRPYEALTGVVAVFRCLVVVCRRRLVEGCNGGDLVKARQAENKRPRLNSDAAYGLTFARTGV